MFIFIGVFFNFIITLVMHLIFDFNNAFTPVVEFIFLMLIFCSILLLKRWKYTVLHLILATAISVPFYIIPTFIYGNTSVQIATILGLSVINMPLVFMVMKLLLKKIKN
jgi:hypothetical protein